MTPSNPDTPRSPLATALMLDAVQRIEADGPLDDGIRAGNIEGGVETPLAHVLGIGQAAFQGAGDA